MSSKEAVMSLRQQTGAGIVEIQKALEEAGGDEAKAIEILRKRGQAKALKKQDRETHEGVVASYIHANGRVGSMVELACETDFVARNDDFKNFAREIAMHIAAANPLYISPEDVPEEVKEKEMQIYKEEMQSSGKLEGKNEEMIAKILEGKIQKYFADACLLEQTSIKEDDRTINDLVVAMTAKIGEKVVIKRFQRFAIGE
jgi:elongation factor Ts